jgi:ABC-type phosphate/phosphonate transport system permease subunit
VEHYLEQFINLANGTRLTVLVAMIFANLLTGVGVSIYTRTFRLKAVGNFLLSRGLPYVLSYFGVAVVAVIEPAWQVAVTAVWGIIVASLVGAILTNLKEVGIALPDFLADGKEE